MQHMYTYIYIYGMWIVTNPFTPPQLESNFGFIAVSKVATENVQQNVTRQLGSVVIVLKAIGVHLKTHAMNARSAKVLHMH